MANKKQQQEISPDRKNIDPLLPDMMPDDESYFSSDSEESDIYIGKEDGKSKNEIREADNSGSEEISATKMTTNHGEIKKWVKERKGRPVTIKHTGNGTGETIAIDFHESISGKKNDNLMPISWDDFFGRFDNDDLVLIYEEKTAAGEKSYFYKMVSREEVN